MPDQSSSVAPSHDKSRQDATSKDAFTLTIEEAAVRYDHAGHPRTIRSIQRYCAKGHLDSLRQKTTFGDKYLITPESVARHIAQIAELASATSRVMPRHLSSSNKAQKKRCRPLRQVAASDREAKAVDDRYVNLLERENEFLRDQVTKKDEQISNLSTRFGETQTLLGAMQRMLAPLLRQADPFNLPERRETGESATN